MIYNSDQDEDKKKYVYNARFIFLIILFGFIMIVFYLLGIVFFKTSILSNSHNPRIGQTDIFTERGKIFDSNGCLLADNLSDGTRNYLSSEAFAHIIGYKNKGGSGLEKKYDYELTHDNNEFKKVLDNQKLCGQDIYLTIDKNLQEFIYSYMQNKGAVVILRPSNGKILAMISKPSFNPNDFNKIDIDEFSKSKKDAPLLNRATHGLYPPGSVFKIITTVSAMRNIDLNSFEYVCHGVENFDKDKIHCFNSKAHKQEDIKKAFTVSCNTFFAKLGDCLNSEALSGEINKIFSADKFNFELGHSRCFINLKKDSDRSELIQTSIGQGKTLVTPIYMAMLAGAIANDGKLVQPTLVERVGDSFTKPKEIKQIFSSEESNFLTEIMQDVITSGTAQKISMKNIKKINLAGKTGSAENSSGKDHGWFVVFDKEKDFAMSILLENSGGSTKSVELAGKIINFIYNLSHLDKYY